MMTFAGMFLWRGLTAQQMVDQVRLRISIEMVVCLVAFSFGKMEKAAILIETRSSPNE